MRDSDSLTSPNTAIEASLLRRGKMQISGECK